MVSLTSPFFDTQIRIRIRMNTREEKRRGGEKELIEIEQMDKENPMRGMVENEREKESERERERE